MAYFCMGKVGCNWQIYEISLSVYKYKAQLEIN